MIITDIASMGVRRRIYIDEEFAFSLYKNELSAYGIKQGEPLSVAAHRSIMKLLADRAKKRAYYLLEQRRHTEAELRKKLARSGYPEAVIEEIIASLIAQGLIDDLRYTEDYISYHCKEKSKQRIISKLMTKGINADMALSAYGRIAEDAQGNVDGGSLEKAQISDWLRKKRYDKDSADMKEKQRIYMFLMRKGYSSNMIREAMGMGEGA